MRRTSVGDSTENRDEPGDHGRVGDVKVRAVADRFFHSISQVSECADGAFDRNRHDGAERGLRHDNINVLRLKPAEHGALRAGSDGRIEKQNVSPEL
jgi:hypothetical protein